MVSKEQYYARKAAGLCTKCGKSRKGSPSQVRCLACHNKLKKKDTQRPDSEELLEQPSAKEKAENLKQNKVIDLTSNQKICQKCGDPVQSFNIICQKCLKSTIFSKYDALARYGNCCALCKHDQVEDLKIVSSNITKPMQHKDQELFRLICYRRLPSSEYRALCHNCYWQQNLSYLRQLRTIFDRDGVFNTTDEEDEDDILDI